MSLRDKKEKVVEKNKSLAVYISIINKFIIDVNKIHSMKKISLNNFSLSILSGKEKDSD